MPSRAVGIIPARHGSTRFPGKPLALIGGTPMIQHVWRRAARARLLDGLLVATDDRRIFDCVSGFGGRAVMTSKAHATGTDRLAEALSKLGARGSRFGIVVNIQGDEPLVAPGAIDALVRRLRRDPAASMATPVCRTRDPEEVLSPNTVKVALDRRGRALYFSRSPIPHFRDGGAGERPLYYKHIGLYAYRRAFLRRFRSWPRGPLERAESLEQLRALEHGAVIAAVVLNRGWPAVDTPDDLKRAARLMDAKRPASPRKG
ncbi:MAG TPA: 3-deoxy-manno-octulosonate cytidylyltransferase [candidate division Zixibacteria bacterium]|nr:3-deoxy-manno-octulosonate cytidylyltransferase [candidate division Zixibacteria bacterium]